MIDTSLHLVMTTQTSVSIFDFDLYFIGHRLGKFVSTLASTLMFEFISQELQRLQ